MKIGKIEISLSHLQSSYTDDEQEIIDQYLKGEIDSETINELIEIIISSELVLFTSESFLYYQLYRNCSYNLIDEKEILKLKKLGFLDELEEGENKLRYYINFDYKSEVFVESIENVLKNRQDVIPCLVEFYGRSLTFYIFEWDEDEHSIEI